MFKSTNKHCTLLKNEGGNFCVTGKEKCMKHGKGKRNCFSIELNMNAGINARGKPSQITISLLTTTICRLQLIGIYSLLSFIGILKNQKCFHSEKSEQEIMPEMECKSTLNSFELLYLRGKNIQITFSRKKKNKHRYIQFLTNFLFSHAQDILRNIQKHMRISIKTFNGNSVIKRKSC